MRKKAKLYHIYPCLRRCHSQKTLDREDFAHELRCAILKDAGLVNEEQEEIAETSAVAEDPYLILSFGVQSYFKFLKDLMVLLLEVTALCIPIYMIYRGWNAFERVTDLSAFHLKYTMGNMGGATTVCTKA